jgi:hypothetical protein
MSVEASTDSQLVLSRLSPYAKFKMALKSKEVQRQKLFCRMDRISVFWDIILRSLPKVKQHANDRIPTVQEIKKLIEYPDRRIKPIVLLSVSTGIRVGAWDYMRWKHIVPIKKNENAGGGGGGATILAAILVVYPNEPEEYFTFMTPDKSG